ncbi:hypothetical protein F4808DRAFT_465525 [Astrocystis sublimbata]|nr:hypothetical protein F4808DRAFT_466533 [Astrocystis sublimbata]KAI0191071.1 hypothetical protein F4808DRAFT_465512 [Astrocystis sublimbata]KAI0191084.1 hypothetical protein F4808DRAFT_465525 [Astrocystis sublimbata]
MDSANMRDINETPVNQAGQKMMSAGFVTEGQDINSNSVLNACTALVKTTRALSRLAHNKPPHRVVQELGSPQPSGSKATSSDDDNDIIYIERDSIPNARKRQADGEYAEEYDYEIPRPKRAKTMEELTNEVKWKAYELVANYWAERNDQFDGSFETVGVFGKKWLFTSNQSMPPTKSIQPMQQKVNRLDEKNNTVCPFGMGSLLKALPPCGKKEHSSRALPTLHHPKIPKQSAGASNGMYFGNSPITPILHTARPRRRLGAKIPGQPSVRNGAHFSNSHVPIRSTRPCPRYNAKTVKQICQAAPFEPRRPWM